MEETFIANKEKLEDNELICNKTSFVLLYQKLVAHWKNHAACCVMLLMHGKIVTVLCVLTSDTKGRLLYLQVQGEIENDKKRIWEKLQFQFSKWISIAYVEMEREQDVMLLSKDHRQRG